MGSLKNLTFFWERGGGEGRGGGGFTKNQYRGGDCLKRGLGKFVNLSVGLGKKEGFGVFVKGALPNAHYVYVKVKQSKQI